MSDPRGNPGSGFGPVRGGGDAPPAGGNAPGKPDPRPAAGPPPRFDQNFPTRGAAAAAPPPKAAPQIKPMKDQGLQPITRGDTGGKGAAVPAPVKGLTPGGAPAAAPAAGGVKGVVPVAPVAPAPAPAPPTTSGGNQGLFAASVYASSGGSAGLSFAYASDDVVVYGATPYAYSYAPVPHYYSHCYAPYWSPAWHHHGWGHHHHSAWYTPAPSFVGVSYFSSSWRFSVGFGFACTPHYYRSCWHPFYRVYSYYPYHYYTTVSYYPAYTTVYHDVVTVEYVDSADPYVEYVDEVPEATTVAAGAPAGGAAPAPAGPGVPAEFLNPLVADFPAGISPAECIARGETWFRSGEYLLAAEAFRRGWLARPDDYFAPLQLGHALFASGGRYGLSSFAVSEGLDRNPEWPGRAPDLRTAFPNPEAFTASLRDLQRHVLKNPRDGEARFLLGYVHFVTGDHFAAHGEFTNLRDGGWTSPHLAGLITEAEKRLLGAPK